MKLILTEKIEKVGMPGDVVEVKPGFGRNFLLPRKLAVLYSDRAHDSYRKKKEAAQERWNKEVAASRSMAEKISAVSCTIKMQAGEGDQLYGSVTNQDIHQALEDQGILIDKRQIVIDEAIKKLGMFTVKVKLMPEVEADLKIWVVRQ